MTTLRRLPPFVACFVAVLFGALSSLFLQPMVASAHGLVPDGHSGAPYGSTPAIFILLTFVLLVCAALTASWAIQRQLRGRSLSPLILLFALISIGSLVAACNLSVQQKAQDPFATPAVPTGHEGDEGVVLVGDNGLESVYPGRLCAPSDPVREYHVVAIDVEITLNRYLDYDPQGRMYVLADQVDRVRQEEAQNKAARRGQGEPAVTPGLKGDAIQPLILRVNQGECLRITLENSLARVKGELASIHIHGSGEVVAATGQPALETNSDALAAPGASVTYEWWVGPQEPEGTHYFHSHGDSREQTNHGLFGAAVVEPAGSRYLDPTTGNEITHGWEAIIDSAQGSDFREFALIYHEIGTERYQHLNKFGFPVDLLDRYTTTYKPGGRAINYRSEPFLNRLDLEYKKLGVVDNSIAYSSYAFGDPATPIVRSYLGDPVKQRLVHGGAEVFHVHHVHGGAIRWRRQSDVDPSAFDFGLDKHPPLLPQGSERIDSQSLGPSESYDVENECGSGGCQQSAGDYLFHCHVAQHYVSGMWGIWRVYNTLQDVEVAQDSLPPLLELPDRSGKLARAVTSDQLPGTTVDWKGKSFAIDKQNLAEWVERQLPPPGVAKKDDASVLDWQKEGDLYLNEVESDQVWPGYASKAAGQRPPIYFDPLTGKLAYPFLRPHLGKRPPFAPNHGPAPFLDPTATGEDPPAPGENGPWSLCPEGTKLKQFAIHAINLPLTLNEKLGIVDPVGELYVLKEQEDEVRANHGLQAPLAIRANAGEDCVDVIFKSELKDSGENYLHSKVSLHIHMVQFDVQAGDGVDTGFNYEQSIRPYTVEGEKLTQDVLAGASSLEVGKSERFQPGIVVGVGMDETDTFEVARIAEIKGTTLVLDKPLKFAHAIDEIVSTEFLRSRWYPDVQFGTAYFHDHVSALTSWHHGLFGALIAEPPGSTYHDPHSGEEVRSGPVVDIHTDKEVSHDITGSFRELVLFLQDDSRLTKLGDSTGSAINLRVEPFRTRGTDPARLFSSTLNGDPETPLLESYLGDPIVIRSLVPATHDVHTLHVDGHWFRMEPFSGTSPPVNTVHLGISERYDLMIPKAGGPQQMPGDYLYYNGRSFKMREGSWGLIRVYDKPPQTPLQSLPGHEAIPPPAGVVCPLDAPVKHFDVDAVEAPLPMLGGKNGRIYLLDADKEAVLAGEKTVEPLVLHVNVGDCIQVELHNEISAGPVSFHADMLAVDPRESLGVEAGYNPAQVVMPGESRQYTLYAHPEVGETVALVRDWGNIQVNPGLGLYGAIIVGAAGSSYRDPITGADLDNGSSWRVDVQPPEGTSYRDFTLFLQDEDEIIGTAIMPYEEFVRDVVGLNYRTAPLTGQGKIIGDVFRQKLEGEPTTPLLEAYTRDPIRLHVLVPFSEQAHVFMLDGHQWRLEAGRAGSDLVDALQVGAMEAITVVPLGGAGGTLALPGDYLYGDGREPFLQAGLWGLLRVYDVGDERAKLLTLPDR